MTASVPRLNLIAWSSLVAVALAARAAHADPAPTPDVAGAPSPGDESGRVDPGAHADRPSTARAVARAVLFVPKALLWLVLTPVRGGLWLYDRYQFDGAFRGTFHTRDDTFGIVPTFIYQTGFGPMLGAELRGIDLFGERERLMVGAAYGGPYQMGAETWMDTGQRLGPVTLRLGGNFDRFSKLRFYGIGNDDGGPRPPFLVDPISSAFATETRYRYQELRAAFGVDWAVLDDLRFQPSVAVTDLRYGPSESGTPIDAVFDPVGLVGFIGDVTHVYGEVQLRWDRRRIAAPAWETTTYTAGWLVSAFAGRVHQLEPCCDFTHYGVDLQQLVHLGIGPRMVVLRLWGEGVTGSYDEVPFSELPYLGGDILRGYDFMRFRDRVALQGTAEYVWDVGRFTNAFLFVDAGRVYPSLEDFTFDGMRVGYGGGLSIHTRAGFLIAATLASSIDGGIFVTARLGPLLDEVPRWR